MAVMLPPVDDGGRLLTLFVQPLMLVFDANWLCAETSHCMHALQAWRVEVCPGHAGGVKV